MWADITISTFRTADEQAIAAVHEGVHQFLTPKLYILRNFRIANREGSYFGSSLWRYIEEALAQTIALGKVKGFQQAFVGLKFPVQNGYVFLVRGGGFADAMRGQGLLTEARD